MIPGTRIDIAFHRYGDPGGWPVVLLHGFPFDPHAYDDVAARLAADGADVVVPYLRGYGPSTYREADGFRSGQQAALAHDLAELIAALRLDRPIVAGYDWGGRAACVAALLWPETVSGLVTVGGYNVQDIAAMSGTPAPPDVESRVWYQWYFHSERGRAGLARYRRELTRQLWAEWSPGWAVPDGVFDATAAAFDNPDFVPTVIHSYRHRYGLADGDPAYAASEAAIARTPPIRMPTVVIDPTEDPIMAPDPEEEHAERFTQLVAYRRLPTGHNTPQEDPAAFADAVREVRRATVA
ncbi:alpha/beta hydrolase [Tersicoccus sp. Bi-70]|nr:alpha/beta hydrolase [Tersicoccus sp. Bi-70]